MAGPVYQLLYISTAAFKMEDKDISAILAAARRHNSKNAVSGLLLHRDGKFLQLLECSRDVVKDTYEWIISDTRHSGSINIMERGVDRRLFENWTMSYGDELIPPSTATDLFARLDRALQSPRLDQRAIISIVESFSNGAAAGTSFARVVTGVKT